jgi:hypothetical protein
LFSLLLLFSVEKLFHAWVGIRPLMCFLFLAYDPEPLAAAARQAHRPPRGKGAHGAEINRLD